MQLTVAAHNRGHGAIHSLDLRAAVAGESLGSAQEVGALDELRADERRTFSFEPGGHARIVAKEGGPELAAPLYVVALYGGSARRVLTFEPGPLLGLVLARDRRMRRRRRWLGGLNL